MQLSNYPDLLAYTRRSRTTAEIKNRMLTASQEAVTGLKSDLTKATNGDLGRAHLLKKAQSDIEQSQQINTLSKSRLSLMSGALTSVRDTIDNIDSRTIVALNTENPFSTDALIDEARANVKNMMSSLGVRHGERNLFSADKTDTPTFGDADAFLSDIEGLISSAPDTAAAISAIDDYFADGGDFETRIYQGGDGKAPHLPIGNGRSIEVSVSGKSQSIKDVLKGMAILATSKSALPDGDKASFNTLMTEGARSVTKATTGLVQLDAEIGIHMQSLETAGKQNESEALDLATSFQNLFGRDQYEAAGELKQLQIQLEASYAITARLSNLTLTNFL